jgi:hypothetical protein
MSKFSLFTSFSASNGTTAMLGRYVLVCFLCAQRSSPRRTSTETKMAQSGDVSAGRVPGDSISSLSMNGTLELYPTLLVAGSWDATVGSFNYDISNVV